MSKLSAALARTMVGIGLAMASVGAASRPAGPRIDTRGYSPASGNNRAERSNERHAKNKAAHKARMKQRRKGKR